MMPSSYERIAATLLKGQPKSKPFGLLLDGKFLTGTLSLHRTRQSRTWRLFWRLKQHQRAQCND